MKRRDTRRRKRRRSQDFISRTLIAYDEWYERSIEFAKSYLTPVLPFRLGSVPAVGSGLIVLFREQYYLITAGHVVTPLAEYGNDGRLQIGRDRYTIKDALSRIETRSAPDLAVMRLEADEVRNTRCRVFPMPSECPIPEQGTMSVVVGNLGATKSLIPPYGIVIYPMQFFGRIDTVEFDQFSFRLDDDRYDAEPPIDSSGTEIADNGGISGAGVFTTTDPPQLLGFVHEGIAWTSREHKIYGVPAHLLHDLRLFDAADTLYSNHPCSTPPDPMMERLSQTLPRVVRLRQGGPALEVHTLFEAIQLLETLKSDYVINPYWVLYESALRRAVESGNPEYVSMATDALENLLRSRGWLDE
jgi:hypothetical protein